MTEPTKEDVLKSVSPKSDQLNADDLLTGPMIVTITGVRRGDNEQPIVIDIEGHQPYKPCKSMRRVLIAAYGDEPQAWIGKRLKLYNDPEVKYAGVKVGGVRIAAMSGIPTDMTYMLTASRGKKSEFKVAKFEEQVEELTDADAVYIADALSEIENADSLEVLKAIGFTLRMKEKNIQDAVRPAYKAKQERLESHGKA